MPSKASAALFLAATLASLPAAAVLYKWIDADGKTQYGDQPPKNFKGEVIRLDFEADKTTLPSSPPPAPAPAPAAPKIKPEGEVVEDIATKRRNTRSRLDTQLKEARAKVDSARKALADSEAEGPAIDERQVVQQRAASGGMHGMTGRSNCRVEGSGSKKILMCPTFVPSEEYQARVARLEEDIRKAEAGLAAAEEAWRRGVD